MKKKEAKVIEMTPKACGGGNGGCAFEWVVIDFTPNVEMKKAA
jgi:hypothetical protein